MNSSYLARLLCLSLATFFLVHLILGAMVACGASQWVRLADRMKPRRAARSLLALRLFPSAGALFAVAGICVPSYLWFEPRGASEDIGAAFVVAALLGAVICGVSIARGAGALVSSVRYIRDCQRTGEEVRISGERVCVVQGRGRIIALAGMVRPTVLISREVISRESISALTEQELHAVLRHERGHAVSHDNLSRLVVTLAPDLLPFIRRGFSTIERAWVKFAEWAADDYAAMGDPGLSLSLASALVRVARIPAGAAMPSVLTPFIDGGFSARVDRLMADPVTVEQGWELSFSIGTVWARTLWASIGIAAAVAFLLLLRPASLLSAHMLLERLIK